MPETSRRHRRFPAVDRSQPPSQRVGRVSADTEVEETARGAAVEELLRLASVAAPAPPAFDPGEREVISEAIEAGDLVAAQEVIEARLDPEPDVIEPHVMAHPVEVDPIVPEDPDPETVLAVYPGQEDEAALVTVAVEVESERLAEAVAEADAGLLSLRPDLTADPEPPEVVEQVRAASTVSDWPSQDDLAKRTVRSLVKWTQEDGPAEEPARRGYALEAEQAGRNRPTALAALK